MLANIFFALFLIGLLAVLFWRHWQQWRNREHDQLNPRDADFFRRQLRRRVQASAMIGMVGLAVLYGQTLSVSVGALAYWLVVVLVVLWIMLLALADVFATRMHLSRMRRDVLVEQACLEAELRRSRGTDVDVDP